ncbi:hypothetical protein HanRHA438_Chr03g0124381 [Helianthus annuus]|nr:hypothetical protein HanRHA438_Chr03g0124381 [Helianthus annuus]
MNVTPQHLQLWIPVLLGSKPESEGHLQAHHTSSKGIQIHESILQPYLFLASAHVIEKNYSGHSKWEEIFASSSFSSLPRSESSLFLVVLAAGKYLTTMWRRICGV